MTTPNMIRVYLRASTKEQDATRAKAEIAQFTNGKGYAVAYYQENASGTRTDRPELARLLSESQPGDILLVEKVDRLARLPYEVWQTLKHDIQTAGITIVSIDQPLTHPALAPADSVQSDFMKLLTNFMLDLGATQARDDYDTRRKRQAEGIAKAKEQDAAKPVAERKYRGRKEDSDTNALILTHLRAGMTPTEISRLTLKGKPLCSRRQVYKVRDAAKADGLLI